MRSHHRLFRLPVFVSLLVVAVLTCFAQNPAPTPASPEREPQEEERVFTEEVRIPLFATDERGRFDPSLELDDVLVLEDDVPQEIRSVRRIPASVLLLVGTGIELNRAIRTSTLRDASLNLVSHLREGDSIAIMQFNTRVEGLQKWTTERERVAYALKTRLKSGRGSRVSQAIVEAASYFEHQPVGNRHLVLITDGLEAPGRMDAKEALRALTAETPESKAQAAEAVRQIQAAQVTVHVVNYSELGRKLSKQEAKERKERQELNPPPESVTASGMATAGLDPTMTPNVYRGSAMNAPDGTAFRFDPAMRKLRKAYEQATRRSAQRLSSFTEETGGRMWQPAYDEEMLSQGAEIAREIGAQYVVTYRPKRPLTTAPANEYRRIRVAPRRIGLRLRARRGYVVAAMR